MNKNMSAKGGSAFGGKKFLFLVPVILLLAAACNKQPAPQPSQQTNNYPQQQTQTLPQNPAQQTNGQTYINTKALA